MESASTSREIHIKRIFRFFFPIWKCNEFCPYELFSLIYPICDMTSH